MTKRWAAAGRVEIGVMSKLESFSLRYLPCVNNMTI
jgi:hypothetical protein